MGDDHTTAAAVAAWSTVSAVQGVAACDFLSEGELLATTTQKDLALGTVRRSLQSFTRAPSGAWAGSGFPVELSAETSLVVPSPSGVLLAKAVRVSGAGAAPTGLFPAPVTAAPELGAHTRVDITDRTGSVVAAITLPSVVYADGWFEGCAWCLDESQLVVVAEAPRAAPPSRGYFATSGEGEADGSLYDYDPDWGEAKVGMHRSVLLLLDVSAASATVLAPTSTEISCGTPVWGPTGEVVFSGT